MLPFRNLPFDMLRLLLALLLLLASVPAFAAGVRVDQLLREGLIAEGAAQNEIEACEARWQGVVTLAHGRIPPGTSKRDAAAQALAIVYEQVATGRYIADCTSLRRAFREGIYNCVSITILYQSLCEELGLPTTALARPGHVLCRVWLGDGPPAGESDPRWLPVETTCRDWFTRPASPASQPLRPVTPAELVAKIYYNRGVELLHRQDFSAAVAATERAWRLDPADTRARDNHLAALNNGAIWLTTARRYAEARLWLARARAIDPSYPLLSRNEAYLYRAEAAAP
jgi:tetratricopeptide (TPR) repeat protein